MSKSNGLINSVSKVIAYILTFLLILGIVGGVSFFALRSQGITYYVEYEGKKYFGNAESGNIALSSSGKPQKFTVKSLTGKEVNYAVTVTSNAANNFTFTHDGTLKRFYGTDEADNDYSEVFGLEKNTDCFSLTIPAGANAEEIVSQKYGGNIVLQSELQPDLRYFVITVSVEESNVLLYFGLTIPATGVALKPSEIVF
jgi:hypothetical protein